MLAEELRRWDGRLADLGGDPSREDWSHFRPLLLAREEHWSDWLAHLIEHARSGRFPARLFGRGADEAGRWSVVRAEREERVENYRADLVVRFRDGTWIHLEVKTGDPDLEKTPRTGNALRRREPGCRTEGDFLLLLERQRASWDKVQVSLGEAGRAVRVLTWTDVARALRASLDEAVHESTSWRVWARTLVGAIEQQLLGWSTVQGGPSGEGYRPTVRDFERVEFLKSMEVL